MSNTTEAPQVPLDEDTALQDRRIETLVAAVQAQTVAIPTDEAGERRVRREWQQRLETLFPLVHATLERIILSEYALVYVWNRSTVDLTTGEPVLVMAHYDVVDADPAGWTVDPWAGTVRDGAIWGRGTIDDKLSHIGVLQAVEELLHRGYAPERPIVLAFGGDEEVGGRRGAGTIAAYFRERGVRFATVLDEGAIVADGMFPGVDDPIGLIGCAEKGHVNVYLSAVTTGGHAAHPPRRDASQRLARAIDRVSSQRTPVRRTATIDALVTSLGSYMSGISGAIMRLYPLTAPLVHRALSKRPETAAMLTSTKVVTMLGGSDAPNVLPQRVWANINARLLPGDTIEAFLERTRRKSDPFGVEAHLSPGWDNNEAPPESAVDSVWYDRIARSIRAVWGDIPVIPYLVTATTDSRHYADIADTTYRFVPMQLTADDLSGVHGNDEHISIDNVHRAVSFYRTLLMQFGEYDPSNLPLDGPV
jgi:carboxypeptidase PM20D1